MKPQLATLVDKAPAGDEWLHEIKFDGYRILARLQRGKVVLLTRNGHDWTHRFQGIAEALATLPLESGVIDGEVVALTGVDLEVAGPVAPNARVELASVNGGVSLTVPADTRAVGRTCGSTSLAGGDCHADIAAKSLRSGHATLAGQISGGLYFHGLTDKVPSYAIRAVTDPASCTAPPAMYSWCRC